MEDKDLKEELSLEAKYVTLALANIREINEHVGTLNLLIASHALTIDVRSMQAELFTVAQQLEELAQLTNGRGTYIRRVWDEHEFSN